MRAALLIVAVLAACGAALSACGAGGAQEGGFRSTEGGVRLRVVRTEPGTYRVDTLLEGDARNPEDVPLMVARSAARSAVDPLCTNGEERVSGDSVRVVEQGPGFRRTYAGRFVYRCSPDPRSAEELEALRNAPRERPHPCGFDFDAEGRATPARC